MPGRLEDWYHVTSWTYEQWVRGDLRGWRARHHREHCEGDYRHRPDPSDHEAERENSYSDMRRDPIRLVRELRRLVVNTLVARLIEHDVEVICAELDAVHLHLLGRFPKGIVRRKMGFAKQHATTELKAHCSAVGYDLGLKVGEGLWGKRCGVKPVESRNHQLEAFAYILGHEEHGAEVWFPARWTMKHASLRDWVERRRGRRG